MCFPGRGAHITWNTCFLGGEHISLGICVSLVGVHISLGICVSQVGEYYMFFLGREHMSLGIHVSKVGERISVDICVSKVTGGKKFKLAGDSGGCRRILTTLSTLLRTPS